MSGGSSTRSLAGGIGVVVFLAAYLVMLGMGLHRTILLAPLALGLAALVCALKPMVEVEKQSALYFAIGILAFMIFFLHETYEFKGKERNFPLIIGYAGIVLSLLDIASVTETVAGRFVTRFFGATLDPSEIKPREVRRELLVFGVMVLGVIGIWLFGFLIASPIFVFLWMLLGGGKSVKLSLYVGLGTFVFVYLLFEQILSYELYRGEVTTWIMDMIWE
ncbi:MAG: tripartite tricarboxylate transporter TctB family protein [Alphaproteobacteria bacterium]|nr:tripartite tricarboxylate transporter TctB family protein [Alphaproteobacteria bacterium]